jgi:hypothetical protein
MRDLDPSQYGGADRREVDPPIEVESDPWSPGGQLDWWFKDRQQCSAGYEARTAGNGGSALASAGGGSSARVIGVDARPKRFGDGLGLTAWSRYDAHAKFPFTGQALNRIGAELYHFGLPRDVSFPYRLLCAEGSDIACPQRATDPQAAVPKQPGTQPARPPTQPDTDSPPVCTAGDTDKDGVCDDVDTCTGGGADLEPTAITYDVSVVQAGQSVYFDSGVENQGAVDSGVFSIKWLVDGQEVGAYGGHDGVPAKSTVMDGNSQFTWTFDSPGTYKLTFAVDADDHVQCEANESDNVRYKTVQVQQAAKEQVPEETAPTEETQNQQPGPVPFYTLGPKS